MYASTQHKSDCKFSFPDGKVNCTSGDTFGVDLKLFGNCQQLKKEYKLLVYNKSLASYLKAICERTHTMKLPYADTQR